MINQLTLFHQFLPSPILPFNPHSFRHLQHPGLILKHLGKQPPHHLLIIAILLPNLQFLLQRLLNLLLRLFQGLSLGHPFQLLLILLAHSEVKVAGGFLLAFLFCFGDLFGLGEELFALGRQVGVKLLQVVVE